MENNEKILKKLYKTGKREVRPMDLIPLKFNFNGLFSRQSVALGIITSKPSNSLITVVTMKKINNIKIISGIEDVDISLFALVFRSTLILIIGWICN